MPSPSSASTQTRRRFLAHFSGMGLGSTLLPGVLWGQMQETGVQEITPEMLRGAMAVAGMDLTEEEQEEILEGINDQVMERAELRKIGIPRDVSPPYHFSPLVPGVEVSRERYPFRWSMPEVRRPADLEEAAFWSVVELAQLVRTGQVSSMELTEMYLHRLERYNDSLNCVVTLTPELAREQARQADAELARGRYRGPLHGIPWGAKDIIAVRGYPTTWGSDAYRDQVIDADAPIVGMLRDAGAVLVAKLTTGELAAGDNWFGGETKNPWNLDEGSSGSSAGPGSATAAGLVGFSIGTETSGSILSPSSRCGVTGLRPTLGRVSRTGFMALSWTQDRPGPMCRSAEDCALVMRAIARPDGRDMSVVDLPFNWDSERDLSGLRVGWIPAAFDEVVDEDLIRAYDRTLAQVRGLGFDLLEVEVPDFTTEVSAIGVESSAFFYELIQTGRWRDLTRPGRADGMRRARFIPAVDFLQQQRIRMMMMMELARATEHVDVWVAPRATGVPFDERPETPGPTRRHTSMANSATYPAIAMPNGFHASGSPTAVTFYARPFGESELLGVAKAWQEVSGHHLEHPVLEG